MLNRKRPEEEFLQMALGPSKDCPPIDELEKIARRAAYAIDLAGHLQSCPYCRTELHLLQAFNAVEADAIDDGARKTAALLENRGREIFRQAVPVRTRTRWWTTAFSMPRLAQASLALAVILAVAGITIHFRSATQPDSLNEANQIGQEVLRSGSFAVISPAGDVQERPKEVRWGKVPNAVTYGVHLMEVDRNELWNATTKEDHIDLPASVRSRIVPAKTLFCEIDAFDSSGGKVGDTGLVRFRLLQGGGSR